MQSILEKIYTGTADEAVSEILETYQQEDFSVVNFVYFANIVSQSLFSDKDKTEKEREYKARSIITSRSSTALTRDS